MLLIALCCSIIVQAQSSVPCEIADGMGDITNQLEVIANIPAAEGMIGRDRNLWDLQVFNDRVYLGFGNTTTNAGPINLYSFDVNNTKQFEREIPAEAIEKFRVINNQLYLPNSDPLGGQNDTRKLSYKEQNGVWTDINWSPALAHTRDMIEYKDSLYLLGNSWSPASKDPIYSSIHMVDANLGSLEIDHITSELETAVGLNNPKWNWFFGGFVFHDTLVLPNLMLTKGFNPSLEIKDNIAYMKVDTFIWSANMPLTKRIRHRTLYPVDETVTTAAIPETLIGLRPYESVEVNNRLLISYKTYAIDDDNYLSSYNNSAGVVIKSNIFDDAQFVNFPNPNAVGEDILLKDGYVYVIANYKVNPFSYITYVYKSANPSANSADWEEVLRFTKSNMSRSFEYLDGYFYFGQGNNYGDALANSGRLLRVAVNCIDNNCPVGSACDDFNICTTNDIIDSNCTCIGIYADSDGDGICDAVDCVTNLNIGGDFDPTNASYRAQIKIESDAYINSSLNIDYSAGNEILLYKGFETAVNQTFQAYISPCN